MQELRGFMLHIPLLISDDALRMITASLASRSSCALVNMA
jgi:hypothetical protein